jgi:hypothetical protein
MRETPLGGKAGHATQAVQASTDRVGAAADRGKLHDMRWSAVRNAIRRGVDPDTMSAHLAADAFSRYNMQFSDDLRDAARKIEDGAVYAKIKTDTETDKATAAPSDWEQILQRKPVLSYCCRMTLMFSARMAKLADARDLKSRVPNRT